MKEITFINKTTSSREVSRSTPEERKRINERNREHRARRRNATDRDTPHLLTSVKFEPQGSFELSRLRGSSATISYPQQAQEVPSTELNVKKTPQLVCPLTNTTFADPFNTFSIPMTSERWQVIQFYRDIYYKRLWRTVTAILGTVLDRFEFTRCTPDFVITECLQIPSRMWSLLASSSCNLQHETNMKMKSIVLVDSGTASLRNDLQNSKLDKNSLLTSIHLHLAAHSLNQNQIAEAHLNGARAILRELIRLGDVLPPPTLGMVALVDSELAAHLLERQAREQEGQPNARSGKLLIANTNDLP